MMEPILKMFQNNVKYHLLTYLHYITSVLLTILHHILGVVYPEYIVVNASGSAATTHPSSMGIYRRETHLTRKNFPVWKKDGGDMYIHVNTF